MVQIQLNKQGDVLLTELSPESVLTFTAERDQWLLGQHEGCSGTFYLLPQTKVFHLLICNTCGAQGAVRASVTTMRQLMDEIVGTPPPTFLPVRRHLERNDWRF